MSEFKVVCGKCQSDVAILSDPDGEVAMCRMCGQRDDLDDAQRTAGEHFLHQMIPDLQKSIGKAVEGNNSGCIYRWHAAPL